MSFSRLAAATAAICLFVVAGAASAQPPGAAQARQTCAADFQKACPNAKPGFGGGLRMCAQSHFKEFSSPCQDALKALRSRMQSGKPGAA